MTRTEAIEDLTRLLTAVEVLRAKKPLDPEIEETVRLTARRIVDRYLEVAGADSGSPPEHGQPSPPRARKRRRSS